MKRLSTNGLKSDNHPIIGDILRILNEIIILENRKIFFFWIPSHVGIPGNDVADDLAKDSIYNDEISYNKVAFKEVYPIINSKTLEDTINYIENYDFKKGLKGRKYISQNDKFSYNLWFNNFDLDRKRITLINRIKSGHVRSRDHLFRKNIINSDLCECNNIQTIEHLSWWCPRFANHREPLIIFLRKKGYGISVGDDICNIFNNASMGTILRIVSFILISNIIL